ncbi:hypothetical protein A4244_02720 [Bacillus badius]|nr:hypothetical protein A4244_02720 [Bacillus badius]OCS88196.1 hypothetical protein A6M11_02720 [Bacillus badius]OVE53275.1 hypothetical protein B1A98_00195 [Bacillus badius]
MYVMTGLSDKSLNKTGGEKEAIFLRLLLIDKGLYLKRAGGFMARSDRAMKTSSFYGKLVS